MPTISIASINIERSNHLDAVVSFLQKHRPDIATLQEVKQEDIPLFEKILGMKSFYMPMYEFARPNEPQGIEGHAIFAADFVQTNRVYYAGEHDPLHKSTENSAASIARTARGVSWVQVEKSGELFCIATTHFTWSNRGEATEAQRQDMQALLAVLRTIPEFALTGDFNAPRGGEIWAMLADKYRDNIPRKYAWSLDRLIHRAGKELETSARNKGLPGIMVDGLFTTPHYAANSVELHDGVSDHMAVTATISKLA